MSTGLPHPPTFPADAIGDVIDLFKDPTRINTDRDHYIDQSVLVLHYLLHQFLGQADGPHVFGATAVHAVDRDSAIKAAEGLLAMHERDKGAYAAAPGGADTALPIPPGLGKILLQALIQFLLGRIG